MKHKITEESPVHFFSGGINCNRNQRCTCASILQRSVANVVNKGKLC